MFDVFDDFLVEGIDSSDISASDITSKISQFFIKFGKHPYDRQIFLMGIDNDIKSFFDKLHVYVTSGHSRITVVMDYAGVFSVNMKVFASQCFDPAVL